jgi:hypothetical protein
MPSRNGQGQLYLYLTLASPVGNKMVCNNQTVSYVAYIIDFSGLQISITVKKRKH